jgi:hypothetical protein
MPVLRVYETPTACTFLCVRFTYFVRAFEKKTMFFFSPSATGATLDTGGELSLTRQGLALCKMHQD